MQSIVAKVASRIQLCKLKLRGKLSEITWLDLARMISTPNRTWPTHKLAKPRSEAGSNVIFDTPIGPVCWDIGHRHSLGLLIFEEIIDTYEQGEVKICTGDIVIDLGAHVGTFTRFALHRGAAKVVAFEPEPSHVALLRQTFAEEIREGRVHIVEAATSDREGFAHFQSDGVGSKISDSGEITVPVVRVDDIVKKLRLERVDFIKADIEGAERDALLGARDTIKKFGPRMALCTYHLPDDPKLIPEIVRSIRPYRVTLNVGREQAYFRATPA
jgi:FkbM family methyltransferase